MLRPILKVEGEMRANDEEITMKMNAKEGSLMKHSYCSVHFNLSILLRSSLMSISRF